MLVGDRRLKLKTSGMKRFIYQFAAGVSLTLLPFHRAQAQIEIIGDIIKEAIMAADLAVQKVQTQTVYLQEAQKELENIMAATRLGEITDWVRQQKDLYNEYYQELWQVKNALSTYQKVIAMIDKQAQLVAEYQQARALIGRDSHFSAEEVTHIYNVYSGILSQSVENIGQLALVINAFVVQMDDGDRLHLIDATGESIDKNSSDLRNYTQENILISMQRAKDQDDLNGVRVLYGIGVYP
jgi:DNA repair ATPase RecN